MSIDKRLVTTKDELDNLLNEINQAEIFAYDTETNGKFSRFEISLVGISFGFADVAYYIPLGHLDTAPLEQLPIDYVLDRVKPVFEDPDRKYVAHNAKFDEMVLSVYGIECQGSGDDTFIMAWLLSEDRGGKGLKALVKKHLDVTMETYEDVVSKAPKKRGVDRDYSFARVPLKDALSYAADDAFYTLKLYNLFLPQLAAEKLLEAYERIERPFNRVLRHIEGTGVAIDTEYLDHADRRLPSIAEEVEAEIYEEAGEVFNIGSPQQLGKVLFEKLKISSSVPKTAKGNFATDKKTLSLYATKHKIVDNILRRKKIQKTHSTFVAGLKEFVENDNKVHPSFNGCGTVTGRLSCSKPNLQQIEGDEVEEIKVRNFFVPSPGYVFCVGDYSQVELRVMAHLAKDDAMINAFISGRDFHEETARAVFRVPAGEEVSHRQRFGAKAVNFGTGYGRGPASIAEQTGSAVMCAHWPKFDQVNRKWQQGQGERCHDCAKCFIEDWYDAFPGVRRLKEKTLEDARRRGFVRTLSGRKRRLPDIRSQDYMARGGAERQAFNTRIQGSAADIIKLAMIALEPALEDLGARMCIQIHDELVVEAPKERAEEVVETMKYVMENPLNGKNPLVLPLVTEPKIVSKWGDAK